MHVLTAVDIRDIKEVRRDKNSREFERCFEDSKRFSNCLVIHYGSEFRLATISCAGKVKSSLFFAEKMLLSCFTMAAL